MTRVLGLDPGSRLTGWGVLDDATPAPRLVAFGRVALPRSSGRANALKRLQEELDRLLAEFRPAVVVLERSFTARYPGAGLALAEVRGAALAVLGRWGGTVHEYPPAQVKAAVVGNGRAEKRQVAFVVQHTFALPGPPPHDAADAIALALCYLRLRCLDARAAGMLASVSAAWTQLPDCGRDTKCGRPVRTGEPE
ncbi:MAG: crossover junction endodeoxyribonuclease RuvC [Acidobacteriota bacterium]|jgi:crossover junction endodeoxyribonuclease RuvC